MKENGLTGRALYWLFPGQYKHCRCCCLFCRWYGICREDTKGPGQVHGKENMEGKDGKEKNGGARPEKLG